MNIITNRRPPRELIDSIIEELKTDVSYNDLINHFQKWDQSSPRARYCALSFQTKNGALNELIYDREEKRYYIQFSYISDDEKEYNHKEEINITPLED